MSQAQIPPSMGDEPVSEPTLVDAVVALGASTAKVGDKIDELKTQRRGITYLLVAMSVIVIVQAIYGFIALDRLSNTDRIATALTSQQAQRDQIARADFRTDRTIFCINSFAEAMQKNSAYDNRCPQAYPGVPITQTPDGPSGP